MSARGWMFATIRAEHRRAPVPRLLQNARSVVDSLLVVREQPYFSNFDALFAAPASRRCQTERSDGGLRPAALRKTRRGKSRTCIPEARISLHLMPIVDAH